MLRAQARAPASWAQERRVFLRFSMLYCDDTLFFPAPQGSLANSLILCIFCFILFMCIEFDKFYNNF